DRLAGRPLGVQPAVDDQVVVARELDDLTWRNGQRLAGRHGDVPRRPVNDVRIVPRGVADQRAAVKYKAVGAIVVIDRDVADHRIGREVHRDGGAVALLKGDGI